MSRLKRLITEVHIMSRPPWLVISQEIVGSVMCLHCLAGAGMMETHREAAEEVAR
jgi:hypothetical protein